MPEIGEMVKPAIAEIDKSECIFCESENSHKKEDIEIVEDACTDSSDPDIADDGEFSFLNDSGELSENITEPKPGWKVMLVRNKADYLQKIKRPETMPLVECDVSKDEEIPKIRNTKSTKYYLGSDYPERNFVRNRVCANAHHIIPGGASLSKARNLLKWFANKVVVKSVSYDRVEIPVEGGSSAHEFVSGVHSLTTIDLSITDSGSQKTVKTTEISGKVYGKITYNINGSDNGVWLPSNNSIVGWKKMSSKFKNEYVKSAIESTSGIETMRRQFHDSHAPYSEQVKQCLESLANAISERNKKCIGDGDGESHRNDDGIQFAPQRISDSLDVLSRTLKSEVLIGKIGQLRKVWHTSGYM